MTALAGRWNLDGKADAPRDCARMLAAQSIYGAHDTAQWDTDSLALGRRLHRALPEDIHDAQPLTGGAGRFVMVADVRLDNRDELIAALQIAPSEARMMADSAILLVAWERWSEAATDHLVGEYAFVVWDAKEHCLHLARDPLGGRPLHYHSERNFFAFASMPKGLHALAEIPRAPNEDRIADYLVLLPEDESQSFFKNVQRLPAGSIAKVTRNGMTRRLHWQPQRRPLKLRSTSEYAEGMLHHLDQAVRAQLRGAGTAVGAHLSSGFDSSAVTASAALAMASRNGGVVAFTSVPRAGYDGPSPRGRHGDEGPVAALTAARYPNIEHVLVRGGERSPLESLDRNFFLFDMPVLNLCNMTWGAAINDAARARKLSVVLTGQMGNMTISYNGETLLPQLLRTGRWLRWAREAIALSRNGYMRPIGVMGTTFGPYVPAWFWVWINRVLEGRNADVTGYSAVRPELLASMDLPARASQRATDLVYRPRKDGFEARLWVLRRVDLGNVNKGVLAGWGIDQRDPTWDRRLVEYCLSIPEDQVLVNGITKAVSRAAFADRLPREVVESRTKGYQAVDWHEALTAARPQLREELDRLEACGPAATAIDLPRLRQLVDNWPEGGWHRDSVMRPYRLALLRAISTGHFVRRATGSNA
jgi:asparagine synthase (glutamine-hydrolysing)